MRQRLLATLAVAAVVLVPVAPARAQEPAAGPRQHVVKRGDTLWDLAQQFIGNPFLWPRIYDANRGIVKDPHWIYPGQKLTIPPYSPPTDSGVAEARAPAQPQEPAPAAAVSTMGERTRFYRPPQGPDTSGINGVTVRPAIELGEFLAMPWLGDPATLAVQARMLDRVRVEGQADRLRQLAIVQDEIYLRMQGAPVPAPGSELLLVRVDAPVRSYGSMIVPTALLRVERGEGEVAVARIVRQYDSVLKGQSAIPVPDFRAPPAAAAEPVEGGPEGVLVAFQNEQPLHTTADLGFVTFPRGDALALGDELEAYAPRRPELDGSGVELPPEDVARLLVVKVSGATATVRVLSMRLPALQPGLRVRLVARVR